jgi:hypothetical protein
MVLIHRLISTWFHKTHAQFGPLPVEPRTPSRTSTTSWRYSGIRCASHGTEKMRLKWRRARRCAWPGFVTCFTRSYPMALRRGRGGADAIKLAVTVARWHRARSGHYRLTPCL